MTDTANNVIDSQLTTALGQYFNGVSLRATVGDCAILTGVRKQNGAPVDIYTPSFASAQDDEISRNIGKAFSVYEKLNTPRVQAPERLLATRAFKKTPALAVLSCPVPVFDDAFDTRPVAHKLATFEDILEGLAALHGAQLVHGNLSPDAIRREAPDSALRLCDLTFSGTRATTVTGQPVAFQSRNVINTATPGMADDVHAAGMLGYRILLGEAGPARVLGGAEDAAGQTAAILGEPTDAPTAETLFPDGHDSGDQIARLLARMTGRLANTAPYSNAEAALRAFRTVRDTPGLASAPTSALASPMPLSPQPSLVSPQSKAAGVSKVTALTLFAGFLLSTGAAAYFAYANDTSIAERDAAMTEALRLSDDLTAASASTDAAIAGHLATRASAVLLAQATYSGAGVASTEAAEALAEGITALDTADAGLQAENFDASQASAALATDAAQRALAALETAREAATEAEAATTTALAAAESAAQPSDSTLAAARDTISTAAEALQSGRYAVASDAFSSATASLANLLDALKTAADDAKTAATSAMDNAESGAAAVLGRTYITRGDAAYAAGAFADATLLFNAALDAFGSVRETPVALTQDAPKTRSITVGDTPAQLEAAVKLCLTDAPIADSNCPTERPSGEGQRDATLNPYNLDATEVSAADFAAFVSATGYRTVAEQNGQVVALTSSGEARMIDGAYTWAAPGGAGTTYQDTPDRPVTNIALDDARAYCDWSDARLPTEAEWEAAGRGTGAKPFPWGDWAADQAVWRGAPTAAKRTPQDVSEAGGASADGHLGLSGNAREWVLGADGPVVKGGSWNTANPADLRLSARLTVPGNAPGVDFGFRCARDAEVWP